jgi:uncharacterized repeat protein (TIGR01451 family)
VLAAAAPIYINNPPTADAGPDQVVCIGYETCFNGSNSTGGDEAYGYNDIVSYEWDFDYDGNESNFTTDAYGIYNCTNFTEYGPGTYWVSLRVCDAWSCCNCDIDGLNVTVIQQYPEITVEKIPDKQGPVGPGEKITYLIGLNNTGDANFTDVEVTDLKLDSLVLIPDANSSDNALNVSETWVYAGTYNVTEEDGCIGWVNNTASVNATTLCETGTFYSNKVSIQVDYSADFNLTKIAEYEGYPNPARPGTQINYTIWINNTGNVTLTTAGAGVYDFIDNTAFKVLGSPIESISPDGVLNVSETWKYEFNVTVNEFGIYGVCDGLIENFVYANFSDPCGNYIQKNYWENVSTDYTADFNITKTAEYEGPVVPGTQINYTIWINNTGDVTLTKVSVEDYLDGVAYSLPGPSETISSDGILNVSENWTYQFNITVTDDYNDICDRWINNTVVANFSACDIYVNKSASANVSTDYTADFNLTKIAEYEGYPNPARPGTQINYTIWINNTGNVTLTTAGAGVYDFIDNTAFKVLGSPIESISPDGVLNVSETWKYEFNVTVNEFGIYGVCDGLIENFVYANFSDPCGNYIQKNYWENVSTDYTADFNITKTAEYEGPVVPGTQINYTIWINNTGDVTLTKVSVEDYLDGVAYSLPGPSETISSDGILNVSENWTYQFNITVTDDYNDICDRWINNTVVANFSACDIYVNKSASANVSTDYTADFNLTKIAEYEGYPNPARPGTQINYTIWINNTGNVTLTTAGAGVYDFIDNTAFKVLGSPIESISPDGVLNVSETWKYEFNVTVNEFGIYGVCDGLIENFVYANFSDPCGNYIQKNYWENVSTDYTADFNITKTAEYEGPVVPGTQINYTIWINNTGDVTLTKVSVEDYLDGVAYSLPGPSETISSDGILNVSENWTYQFNITVTDDYNDICDRWINNTVVANFSACDIYVNKSASANVSTDYTADFEVAKIAEHATPVIPGTQINYTIWINNTGNVNLTEVRVEDFLEGVQYTLPEPTEDLSSDDILSVSEKWMYEFNVTVTDDCGELINNCDGWINNTVIANFSDPCSKFINKSAWANVSTTLCQTADAGNDTIVCGGVAAKLVGNATGFDAVKWNLTEGCGGSLQWPIDGQPFNATYTPPRSGEIQCNLTFTATGPCPNVTDNATVYVVETPIAMIRVEKPSRFA